MHVTVFGASGKVGQLTVGKLMAAGHSVTVFVHNNNPYTAQDNVKIVQGTVYDADKVAEAVQGSEAVISTLGSWGASSKTVLSTAMRAIIPAMQAHDIKRLITLTGSAAWAPNDTISTANNLQHRIFSLLAKNIIEDAETHLTLVGSSDLDWTVVRAPVMSSSAKYRYRLDDSLPMAWEVVPRSAVAQCLVDQLSTKENVRQAPHIHPA